MHEERRREIRIPVDKLPECLKVITFKLGLLEEFSAETVNASSYGMSFVSQGITKMDIDQGQELTVRLSKDNIKLKSTVVYAVKSREDQLKFGVNFHNGYPIEKYHELLNLKDI